MAELFGKVTGCSKGLGGSMHFFDVEHNMLGGYGIVGGHIPLAAGTAFASKYRGDGRVTVVFFGEGAVHRRLPRGHEPRGAVEAARSCSCARTTSTRWARRSRASSASRTCPRRRSATAWPRDRFFAEDVSPGEGADREAAIKRARDGASPRSIEIRTYRYRGHSMSDPGKYRTQEELEERKKRPDAPGRSRTALEGAGLGEAHRELDARSRPRSRTP
jgi:pyruvate dehydrogenase E1 component alpha subunit